MSWGIDPDSGLWTAIGIFLGGGSVCVTVMKLSSRLAEMLLTRAEKKEIRKEEAAVLLREELRADNDRLSKHLVLSQAETDALRKQYNDLFQATTGLETENKLLRSAHSRMRAYLIFQQEELRKALGLQEPAILGIPTWIDDTLPGPTSSQPTFPVSRPRDAGKQALEDNPDERIQ
jgi:hypothetical protein